MQEPRKKERSYTERLIAERLDAFNAAFNRVLNMPKMAPGGTPVEPATMALEAQAVFQFHLLRVLWEIRYELDTLAWAARELVEANKRG